MSHPFEHLGPGPYRFVGTWTMPSQALLAANPSAYNNALADAPAIEAGLGSCAHCWTAITNVFIIECSNGKRYGVGCDCILKLDSADPALVRKVKAAKSEADRQKRWAKQDAKREKEAARIAVVREQVLVIVGAKEDELKALPHPSISHLTLFDYLSWMTQRFIWDKSLSVLKANGF